MIFSTFFNNNKARLLLATALVALSTSFWQLFQTVSAENTPTTASDDATLHFSDNTAFRSHIDYSEIAEWDLFGQPPAKQNHKNQTRQNAKTETRLPLKLLGIVHDANQANSIAIVESNKNRQKYYRIGDVLPGNAKISEIGKDKITIARAGKFEYLKLKKFDGG